MADHCYSAPAAGEIGNRFAQVLGPIASPDYYDGVVVSRILGTGLGHDLGLLDDLAHALKQQASGGGAHDFLDIVAAGVWRSVSGSLRICSRR